MSDDTWDGLRTLLVGRRVKPPSIDGWEMLVSDPYDSENDEEDGDERDESTGACVIIDYEDRGGDFSRRRINFVRATGHFGEIEHIGAFCHERHAYRLFRMDRVRTMWCPVTGLVLDPKEHARELVTKGAIKANDKVLTAIARLLVFVAACDDWFHPAEHEAIEDQIGRYFRFFGGSDDAYNLAIHELQRLVPDGRDALNALHTLRYVPQSRAVARFTIDAAAAVIEADGVQNRAETEWAMEISSALKSIANSRP